MEHKEWINNEYEQWIQALKESTVFNFKEHPMVQRMLGEFDGLIYWNALPEPSIRKFNLIKKIDSIGYTSDRKDKLSGVSVRMLYYAEKVLERNPSRIVEIGGGVGQFYATIRALGFRGTYFIYDLPEVKQFQNKYLHEVSRQTNLNLQQEEGGTFGDFCVSFYALGEFDDETKDFYIRNIVNWCKHGFIIWNPHSGATPDINFKCEIKDEFPSYVTTNKQLTW